MVIMPKGKTEDKRMCLSQAKEHGCNIRKADFYPAAKGGGYVLRVYPLKAWTLHDRKKKLHQ